MNDKPNPPTPFPRSRTPRRAQRGSVLILVVALLVLLALIGTAWISTARVDRASTIQTTTSTEADLLVDGVVNMVVSRIVEDVNGTGPNDASAGVHRGAGYTHTDSPATDDFLASRVPMFLDEIAPDWRDAPLPGQSHPPMYEKGRIVRMPTGSTGRYFLCVKTHRGSPGETPGSSGSWVGLGNYNLTAKNSVDNPVFWAGTTRILPPGTEFEDITGQSARYSHRGPMRIVTVPGSTRPHLAYWDTDQGAWVAVPAADVDGDGMADANYFKLPVGRVNGLDWYAAFRVVDNSSAVNASVALQPPVQPVPPPDPLIPMFYFPSSLNLLSLLMGPNPNDVPQQWRNLERARFNQFTADDFGAGAPINFANAKPRTDRGQQRPDFDYKTVDQILWIALGRRLGNPGYWSDGGSTPDRMKALPLSDAGALAYHGGTLINPDTLSPNRFTPVLPPLSASSVIEQLLHQTLFASADNHPNNSGPGLNNGYRIDVGRKASYPTDNPVAWEELFRRNYDYARFDGLASPRWGPPNPTANDPSTYPNYRALMTVSNPVSTAVPSRLQPRRHSSDPGDARLPGRWNPDAVYDVGDVVEHVVGPNGPAHVFVCISPVQRNGLPPGTLPPNPNALAEHPSHVVAWEPRPFEYFPTKASVNSGSFGQLFLAYWQMMGEPTSLWQLISPNPQEVPKIQSPFKDAFRAAIIADSPADFDSPYWGTRFVAPGYGGTAWTYSPYPPTAAADQNPQRMFRSPIRAIPQASATNGFDARTPRLSTDQVMRLRAALAAVNTIDMRDSDDNITFRDINLGVTLNRGADVFNEQEDLVVLARTRVYGHEKQPFITEIFAQTDTTQPSGMPGRNLYGYVAVELYNPYPFPIDLVNCKIGTIDRRTGTARGETLEIMDPVRNAGAAPDLSAAQSNLVGGAATMAPTIVPANGYLVLENHREGAGGTAAAYRPRSANILPQFGPIADPVAGAQPRNFAYVQNLHTVIDREMVLLRPLGATTIGTLRYVDPAGGVPWAVDMAPLDSFDFTGLVAPNPAAPTQILAEAWHYARPTGTGKEWRFVYPGRYDAHQSIPAAAARPRQQGTREASIPNTLVRGWNPSMGQRDPWDLAAGGMPPTNPPVTLDSLSGSGPWNATYSPYEYAIQLTNVSTANNGAVGPNPVLGTSGNAYPFGGYARNGDILQVPYMGSYRVKLSQYIAPPGQSGFRPGLSNHISSRPNDTEYHQVLELNAITSDSTFAEDTEATNHQPIAGLPPVEFPLEQIGRFTPSILDLEVGAGGTVESVNPPNPGGNLLIACQVNDSSRNEQAAAVDGGNGWLGYEMVITDGPGKGQVRPVVGYTTGILTVYPYWDTAVVGARYILRRGSRWREPGGLFRSTANKFWASDLFDYLTIDSPQDDHFPPADPASYARPILGTMLPPEGVNNSDPNAAAAVTYSIMKGGGANSVRGDVNLDARDVYSGGLLQFVTGAAAGQVRGVTGSGGGTLNLDRALNPGPVNDDVFRVFARKSEDLTPTQGLVNINTAPWQVLALIPWAIADDFDPSNSAGQRANQALMANREIAQRIAEFRDGDPSAGISAQGPFRSLFDLYRVVRFNAHQNTIITRENTGLEPGDEQGDWTPPGTGTDLVRRDFEEQYLLLNRVSNMLTTRSDSFTCYVLVQGIRGGGTPQAEVVVQRRKAFMLDRSAVHQRDKDVKPQFFYNE